jgi:hypothetical protein
LALLGRIQLQGSDVEFHEHLCKRQVLTQGRRRKDRHDLHVGHSFLSNFPGFPKEHYFLDGSQVSPVSPSGKSNMYMKTNMDRGGPGSRFVVDKVALGQVFLQYFSFPCQYHSTNAPYSFIHLPPTLYNVSLPVLQFPLSVSFHQYSILIFINMLPLPEAQTG